MSDQEYEPFGPEWEKEMMGWSKKDLIIYLKSSLTGGPMKRIDRPINEILEE